MVAEALKITRNCIVKWIPDTIHDIGYHKPDELAQVVREFIEGK